jgi:general secretion pathway protein A
LVLAASVLVLVWVAGWFLGKYNWSQALVDVAGLADVAHPVDDAQLPSSVVEDAVTELSVDQPTPELAPPAAAVPGESTLSPAQPTAEVQPEAEAAEVINVADLMLPPADTMASLWSLHSDQPPPAFPCSSGPQFGLACLEGEVWTWEEIAALDRPLALETITPDRFSAEVLLLGIDGYTAWVATQEGVAQLSLAELAPYWTGRYRLLWRPPAGFGDPLVVGEDSAVVAAVAQLFAQLDNQPQPLTGRRFSRALEQRVRLFQRDNALVDDGVVGVQTLLKLNEQVGVDLTAAQARERRQHSTSADLLE